MAEASLRDPRYTVRMVDGFSMAATAALVGDPARATMLAAMFDGRAHTAGELAAIAGVAAPTASGHLARLLEGGLVAVAAQGRHRYYRLASAEVATTLEAISALTAPVEAHPRATPRVPAPLREARTCYDHLAGRLGVGIADTLIAQGAVTADANAVADAEHALFATLGISVATLDTNTRRPLCRACLDWSERRPHLAGALGKAILDRLLERDWVRRAPKSRAIAITPLGRHELAARIGVRLDRDSAAAAA